jgi:hypothetical protein
VTVVANCSECGEAFTREAHESWKRRCLSCWAAAKGIRVVSNDAARAIVADVAANLRLLPQLAHPDRHGGSPAANRATQFLNDLRKRIEQL